MIVVALGAFFSAPSATAHALLEGSTPAADAQVDAPPTSITLRFSEEPEPALSSVEVFDAQGATYQQGPLQPVPGDQRSVVQAVSGMGEGVYTVAWRTVSKVDGHATGGAFAFGVGVDPTLVPAPEAPAAGSPPINPAEVGGRWGLYVGLGLLIGIAWVAALALGSFPPAVRILAVVAWLVSLGGFVVLAEAQRRTAGATYGTLLSLNLGRALLWRAIAIVAAGLALLVARARPDRKAPLVAVGVAAATAMFAHVSAGHAGTGSFLWGKVVAQWVHLVGVGIWLGGLAALLAGIRGAPDDAKASAIRRFSAVAFWALLVVLATGVVRTFNEVGSIGNIWSNGYGRLLVAKVGLLLVLGAMGAINRYRTVPRARTDLRGLRVIARAELVVAAVALLAAASIASLTPPKALAAQDANTTGGPIVVTGSDFGTTVSVELSIDPGNPGPNAFRARVTDYDTGAPLDATLVRLLFDFTDDTSVGETELNLARDGDGWTGSGPNLSLAGRWTVTVVVQSVASSVEIPLKVATRCGARALPVEGGPTLFDVDLGRGRSAQAYADPGAEGFNEIHVTYFAADGSELPVRGRPSITASPEDGAPMDLVVRRLSDGHFVGDAQLTPGRWRFDVRARNGGDTLRMCFDDQITDG